MDSTQIGFLYQHAEMAPPRPVVRAPFPSSLAELALACLAKRPDDRPTMEKVARRLAATSLVRPRAWGWILLAALAIAAVLAAVALVILGYV